MMAGVAYKDILPVLLGRFPEFKEHEEIQWVDLDIPYEVWGAFGHYITDYIRRLPADDLDDDELVVRVFDFANELMDSGDDDTQTIVVVELFENFYPYKKTLGVARRKLKQQHLTWLERQGEWLRSSNFHYEAELIAPNGLCGLARPLAYCSWDIEVKQFDAGKASRLEAYDDRIDITMDSGQGPQNTFFGDVWQNETEARQLLGELSQLLKQVNIAHRIRLYRTGHADSLLQDFRHRWADDVTSIGG